MDLMELIEQDANYHYEVTQNYELGMVNAWVLKRDNLYFSEDQEALLGDYIREASLAILGTNEVIRKVELNIGKGVDLQEFAFDASYRRDAILGQIRTNFEKKFHGKKGGK